MALTLHYHPLSSFCHKVLVALYELDVPFERHVLDFGDAAVREAFQRLWPTGKMPVLVDGDRVVPESSIIIEYLGSLHAQRQLLPADAQERLEVRLWDRVMDAYVMQPMQAVIADRLRPEADRDPLALAGALRTLSMAYGMLEERLQGREWIVGREFSMADCAAAPSLFYAETIHPFPAGHDRLAAYHERLLARPSFARVLEEARPWFRFYPGREGLPARFRPAD